jgi:hypothetical protein
MVATRRTADNAFTALLLSSTDVAVEPPDLPGPADTDFADGTVQRDP